MPYDNIMTTEDAGTEIPEPVAAQIIQSLPQRSVAMQLFRQVRMSTKTNKLPVLSALPSAFWVDGETGLKQTTEMAWSSKTLVAEELAAIVPISQQLLDDNSFPIWPEVQPRLVEAFGAKIDHAALFGTDKPASWPDSIVTLAGTAGNTVATGTGSDVAADLNAVFSAVEADGYDVTGLAARRTFKGQLRGLRSADGVPIYQPSLTAGTPDSVYGVNIAYANASGWDNTKADAIAGDFSYAILGIRQDITFRIFDTGVITDNTGAVLLNLMQQDSVALRAVMRVAYQVANPVVAAGYTGTLFPFGVLTPAVPTP